MNSKQRVAALGLSMSVALGGTAYAAQLDHGALGGWAPVVTLWGGDVDRAISSLDKVTQALSASIHHYEIDEPTQDFINQVLEELKDFDLDGLYALLPDARNGGRELNVKGTLSGHRYLVQRAKPGGAYFVGIHGPRNSLADMSFHVHAKQIPGKKHDTLRMGGNAGVGLGPITFRALADAQRELLRMVTQGHPQAGGIPLPKSGLAREAVREMNPGLGDEDLDALALLFDAYPLVGRVLIDLGRVQDVRTADKRDYFHITTRLKVEPKRMEKKYPALAKHAKKLGDIFLGTMRLVDEQDRTLVKVKMDSAKLTVDIEMYVADGLLLPFDDGKVYKTEPVDPRSGALKGASMLVEARSNMLGLVAKVEDLRVDADIQVHDSYAVLDASMTKMPRVELHGRALGLFAPGFLDLFIPGNIESITNDFLRAVTQGNDGKGLVGHVEVGAKSMDAPGVVSGSAAVEIMDTFLIKLGGGMATERLLISSQEKDEAFKLAAAVHDAFKRDLASFKQRVGHNAKL
jgi:hypothetical protein